MSAWAMVRSAASGARSITGFYARGVHAARGRVIFRAHDGSRERLDLRCRPGGRRPLGSLRPLCRGPDDPADRGGPRPGAWPAPSVSPRPTAAAWPSSSPPRLAAAVDELESISELVARAGAYSGLLFAGDAGTPRHGALMQHVQERSSAIQNALVFFELEWVGAPDGQAEALVAAGELEKPPSLPGERAALPASRPERTRGEDQRGPRQHGLARLQPPLRRDHGDRALPDRRGGSLRRRSPRAALRTRERDPPRRPPTRSRPA